MTTALDVITDAGQRIGVYAPGEVLTSADSTLGLTVLDDMLDSWSNENLTCYAIQEQSAPLTPGTFQYTIGPGGMFNMPRPLRIKYGTGAAYILDTNGNRYVVDVVQRGQWNLIGNLSNINSDIPTTLFYDPQFPLGIMNIFPVPLINWILFWDSYLPFVTASNLATAFSLPPGYMRAIKLGLSVELWPYYKPDTAQPPALLLSQAVAAKSAVKRNNYRPYRALFDRDILRYPRSSYNIYRGM